MNYLILSSKKIIINTLIEPEKIKNIPISVVKVPEAFNCNADTITAIKFSVNVTAITVLKKFASLITFLFCWLIRD